MANRGVLRRNGDLGLAGFRLWLGLRRLRLDQQCRERGTHRGGSSEDVEGDLEAVRERSAVERTDPRVRVHVVGGEGRRDRRGSRDADRPADLLGCVDQP